MDKKLFEAARFGDVGELQSLLHADPLLLERVSLVPFAETPLHVASLAGKTEFVKEILRLKPSVVCDRNKDGLSPLHIASALGDIETARVLLGSIGNGKKLCLLRDHDGRTPLHYAAMKGKVAVIQELVSECSDTIKEATVEGDTALHLAVKNKQFESLDALVQLLGNNRLEVLAAKNKDGFTIFQLAKATYQLQVLELLEGKDTKALRPSDEIVSGPQEQADQPRTCWSRWKKKLENFNSSLDEILASSLNYREETLRVVAALVATVTYQAALKPPKSVLDIEKDMKIKSDCLTLTLSKLEACHSRIPLFYMLFNTLGFLCSLAPLITSLAGPFPKISIFWAFMALIGSYTTLLFAMSSGWRPVLLILAAGSLGLVLLAARGLGFVASLYEHVVKLVAEPLRFWERRPHSPAQGARRPQP